MTVCGSHSGQPRWCQWLSYARRSTEPVQRLGVSSALSLVRKIGFLKFQDPLRPFSNPTLRATLSLIQAPISLQLYSPPPQLYPSPSCLPTWGTWILRLPGSTKQSRPLYRRRGRRRLGSTTERKSGSERRRKQAKKKEREENGQTRWGPQDSWTPGLSPIKLTFNSSK